jgi:hypothetical protein
MLASTDVEEKVAEKVNPFPGMDHLRMKLNPIDSSSGILDGNERCIAGMGKRMKPGRQSPELIAMAHPHLEGAPFYAYPPEQFTYTVDDHSDLSIFSFVRMGDLPS